MNTGSGGALHDPGDETDATCCTYEHCFWVAEVVLPGGVGDEFSVCQLHLRELSRSTARALKPLRLINAPGCFRHDCEDAAVAIMRNVDATTRPACHQHLDDLSWIDVPEYVETHRPSSTY